MWKICLNKCNSNNHSFSSSCLWKRSTMMFSKRKVSNSRRVPKLNSQIFTHRSFTSGFYRQPPSASLGKVAWNVHCHVRTAVLSSAEVFHTLCVFFSAAQEVCLFGGLFPSVSYFFCLLLIDPKSGFHCFVLKTNWSVPFAAQIFFGLARVWDSNVWPGNCILAWNIIRLSVLSVVAGWHATLTMKRCPNVWINKTLNDSNNYGQKSHENSIPQ